MNGNMDRLRKKARDLFRSQGGAVVVWVALSMTMLFAICALGVDASYLYLTRGELQATADAAAHAGVIALWPAGAATPQTAAATAAAQNYAAKNMPAAANGTVVKPADVLTGNWVKGTPGTFTANLSPVNAVRVTAYRATSHTNPVTAWFATFLGATSTDVGAQGTAVFETTKQWDVVIAQDVSTSISPILNPSNLFVQNADQAMADCLWKFTSGNGLAGLLAFAAGNVKVLVPTSGSVLGSMNSVQPLLDTTIQSLGLNCKKSPTFFSSCGGTDFSNAITTAKLLFDTTKPTLLGGVFSSSSTGQGIVLITDCGDKSTTALSCNSTSATPAQITGGTATGSAGAEAAAAKAAGTAGYDLFIVYFPGNASGNQSQSSTNTLSAIVTVNVNAARAAGHPGNGKVLATSTDASTIATAMFGACAENIPVALVW